MAELCCGVVSESDTATPPCDTSPRAARRRRMEIRKIKIVNGVRVSSPESEDNSHKRKLEASGASYPEEKRIAKLDDEKSSEEDELNSFRKEPLDSEVKAEILSPGSFPPTLSLFFEYPKYGVASVCGRRRDMEDAVAVQPWFCRQHDGISSGKAILHYFGVYDGHGCSHVAMRCRERLHELVKEEVESYVGSMEWKIAMERSFLRMDKEVIAHNESVVGANCRCELQTPECDAVGSTAAVAILTADKIIVANCGDSRAVLCRKGKAVPLTSDHKPDRPDELHRIEAAGGRVIFWDAPRVLGVLAMSRAIGDNYLKPYVTCEPEVTVVERSAEDDCLILATDGLWDVVSNDTACGVARMCLRGKTPPCSPPFQDLERPDGGGEAAASDKACSDASLLLTKLALARHSSDNVSVVVVDLRKGN